MGLGYKFLKNYMLPFSGVFLALSAVGLLLSLTDLVPEYRALVRDFNIWVLIISAFVLLVAAWYFGEQLYLRRKFSKALSPEKKSDMVSARKQAEDIARRLPDSYRKRVEAADWAPRSKRAQRE